MNLSSIRIVSPEQQAGTTCQKIIGKSAPKQALSQACPPPPCFAEQKLQEVMQQVSATFMNDAKYLDTLRKYHKDPKLIPYKFSQLNKYRHNQERLICNFLTRSCGPQIRNRLKEMPDFANAKDEAIVAVVRTILQQLTVNKKDTVQMFINNLSKRDQISLSHYEASEKKNQQIDACVSAIVKLDSVDLMFIKLALQEKEKSSRNIMLTPVEHNPKVQELFALIDNSVPLLRPQIITLIMRRLETALSKAAQSPASVK